VRGPSLVAAIQLAQASLGRILTLHHLRLIGFGEAVAREGLEPVLSQLLRHNEIRMITGMAVIRGRSADGMAAFHPALDTNPFKVIEGKFLVQKRLHLTPPMAFLHFYSKESSSGGDGVMPLMAVNPLAEEPPGTPLPGVGKRSLFAGEFPRSGSNPVEFAGTAVFHGDRLAGFLTLDETVGLLALRGAMGKVYATVPNPREAGQWISIRFGQENKPQFRLSFVGGRPVVQAKLQLEGELLSAPGKTNFAIPENRRLLEQHIARYWEQEIYQPMIRQVYGEWGADPVGFGNLLRMRFPSHHAWLRYRWRDHVKELTVNVQVDMYIRRFGMLMDVQQ
jgi:spore germination protein KC